MTEFAPETPYTDGIDPNTSGRGLFNWLQERPRLRGALAVLSIAATAVTGCAAQGEITDITLKMPNNPPTLPPIPVTMPSSPNSNYYGAIEAAGAICPGVISEADIVAQLAVEDGPGDGWSPTVVSSAGAIGTAQWEPATHTELIQEHIISPGSLYSVYSAIIQMTQWDCYNAEHNGGSANAAMQIYNSGHNGGAPGYADLILNQIAPTVQISYGNPSSTSTSSGATQRSASLTPFGRLVEHAGYDVTSSTSDTATAPFPGGYFVCPSLNFDKVGAATFSVGFASHPSLTIPTPPNDISAIGLERYEREHKLLCMD